jgi:CRP/FNR family transcriptional regulator, cyclic AMP receptor protein
MNMTGMLTNVRTWVRLLLPRVGPQRDPDVVSVLRQVGLFQGVPRTVLLELGTMLHERSYRQDEFLYFEHDPGLGLYIVQRGRVRLTTEEPDGRIHGLRHVEQFGVFGDLSVFGDYWRSETAQAVTDTQVLGFFRPDLKTLLKRKPKVGAIVAGTLARHMAAHYTALVRLLSERDGDLEAMRLVHRAAAVVERQRTESLSAS